MPNRPARNFHVPVETACMQAIAEIIDSGNVKSTPDAQSYRSVGKSSDGR